MSEEVKLGNYCPNCQQTFSKAVRYCSECGQETRLKEELESETIETANVAVEGSKQPLWIASFAILMVALIGVIGYFTLSIQKLEKESQGIQDQLAVKKKDEQKWQSELAEWEDPDSATSTVKLKETLAANAEGHEGILQNVKKKLDPLNKAYAEAKAAENSNDMNDVINKYNALYENRNTYGTNDVNELKKSLVGDLESGGE